MATETMSEISERLRLLFGSSFSSDRLRTVKPDVFHAHIKGLIGSVDASPEGYLDPTKQRDLSIRFHWGHTHDFGDGVSYQGQMSDHHIMVIAQFVADFGMPIDLSGKRVLDIGV